ncbi:MAG: hypothetical protein MJZ21_05360 [archaeon]|nr:hypothetical protein [archaeon]
MSNNCLRCGYSWSARSTEPLRCPRCKSTRWNKEVIKDVCTRCGAEWVQRSGEAPKYCPVCHSSMWNAEKLTYTCPKCGKTRTLRSNSRANLCPSCDLYTDSRRPHFADSRAPSSGINNIIHLWSNQEGLTLNYLNNRQGIASLYNHGKLIGEINIESWCRGFGINFDLNAKLTEPKYQEIFEKAVEKINFENKVSESRTTNLGLLRGLNSTEAEVVYLNDTGMSPLSISLKLKIPFASVMDILATIPPIVRGNDLAQNKREARTAEKKSSGIKEREEA